MHADSGQETKQDDTHDSEAKEANCEEKAVKEANDKTEEISCKEGIEGEDSDTSIQGDGRSLEAKNRTEEAKDKAVHSNNDGVGDDTKRDGLEVKSHKGEKVGEERRMLFLRN